MFKMFVHGDTYYQPEYRKEAPGRRCERKTTTMRLEVYGLPSHPASWMDSVSWPGDFWLRSDAGR